MIDPKIVKIIEEQLDKGNFRLLTPKDDYKIYCEGTRCSFCGLKASKCTIHRKNYINHKYYPERLL